MAREELAGQLCNYILMQACTFIYYCIEAGHLGSRCYYLQLPDHDMKFQTSHPRYSKLIQALINKRLIRIPDYPNAITSGVAYQEQVLKNAGAE